MPNLPISQLPAASLPLQGDELFATVQGGITKYSTLSSIKYVPGNSYGLFNQTGASTPVTNTITETSLLGNGVGTLSIPANGFNIGDAFHAISTGHISAVNNHTLRIRIKAGSILLADTGEITMSTATSRHWKLEIFFSINNIGAAGVASISTGGTFMYVKNASVAFEGSNFSTENNNTFDTTINNTLAVTAQWNNANSGDSIYSDIFTLTKTY
jgi:hypothetical protein